VLSIIGSIGKLVITAGGMGIAYLYRRRRSIHAFSLRLRKMGVSDDDAKFLTSGYKDMVSLPGLRQIMRSRKTRPLSSEQSQRGR